MIEINGKSYALDELTTDQYNLVAQLRLVETMGEVMNHAHDKIIEVLSEAMDADKT